MKISELKAMLSLYPDDMEVHIAYNYNDHHNTLVAPKLEFVTEAMVEYSSYHSMHKILDDGDGLDKVRIHHHKEVLVLMPLL